MLSEPFHPIRIAALRTGLSEHRIRIWERRYHAVDPTRTETNRRLYSDTEIERLALLWRAVQQGRSIGQVAPLATEDLRALLREDDAGQWVQGALRRSGKRSPARGIIDACMSAVEAFDGRRLEDLLQRASVHLGRAIVLEEVVGGLFERVGELWHRGALRTAHEHLVSVTVRNQLAAMLGAPAEATAPRLVATTPAGQVHEFGALLAAATAAGQGWNVTYLGPDLPADEIAAAAGRCNARVVALSLVHPADDPQLVPEVLAVRRLLPVSARLLLGGRAAVRYAAALESAGVRVLGDLAALRMELGALRTV